MVSSDFSIQLAKEIVNSWFKAGSNYILVSPPLSEVRSILKRICHADFISLQRKDNNSMKFSISELDTSDFKDEVSFAKKVLRQWHVNLPLLQDLNDAVSILNYGVEAVTSNGHRPIIVIHRFHECLDKLGEDIGTALRNLEHDYQLCTVVELPVSISCLRQRWEASVNARAPFLASDWGQGHTVKFVKGFNLQELKSLTNGLRSQDEMAKAIFNLTAGLPGLVEKLLLPAESRTPSGLIHYAKSQADNLCERLVNWVDKPGDDFYKKLLIRHIGGVDIDEVTKISDHDWSELFKPNEDSYGFRMLVWACNNRIAVESKTWYLEQLKNCFKNGSYADLELLVDSLVSPGPGLDEKKFAAAITKRFYDLTNPFDGNWRLATQVIVECDEKNSVTDSSAVKKVHQLLGEWKPICQHLNDFHVANITGKLRLEEFSLRGNDQSAMLSLIQLFELRLEYAAKNFPPNVAMKLVVEMPETMLQAFSFLQCGIRFWDFGGGSAAQAKEISELIKLEFIMPRVHGVLSFFDLLCLVFLEMQSLAESDRLFSTFTEFDEIRKIYDLRKQQVHSTAIVEAGEWLHYQKFCRGWLEKIKTSFPGGATKSLRSPALIFEEIVSENFNT